MVAEPDRPAEFLLNCPIDIVRESCRTVYCGYEGDGRSIEWETWVSYEKETDVWVKWSDGETGSTPHPTGSPSSEATEVEANVLTSGCQ